MTLNRIKANTLKQETKCKPETNGKYKVRQILTKILEYIHTPHTHTNQNSLKKERKKAKKERKKAEDICLLSKGKQK